MEKEKAVLSLLFLTVIASGCINSDNSTGSVTVKSLNVEPTQIYEGQSVRAWLEIENTGNLPGEVAVGENGERILRGHCPDIFSNDKDAFSVTTTRENFEDGSVSLRPGDELRLRWKLDQDMNKVPLYGLNCDLEFPVRFNYSVSSFKQVEIKRDREVEGSPQLESKSSSGPMKIAVGTIPGSTGETSTYIADTSEGDDSRVISVVLRLQNPNPEEEYGKGVVDVDESSLRIEATDPLELDERMEVDEGAQSSAPRGSTEGLSWKSDSSDYSEPRCEVPSTSLRLSRGSSADIRCDIPLPEKSELDKPSLISEISAHVNYTYEKDAGTRSIEVERRGQ